MGMSPATVALFGTTFVAAAVEVVEAFTIVLAMGLTRSWRATIVGAAAAFVALTVLTAVVGVALKDIVSTAALQLVIGALLLIFGLQWLRKAILRSSGLKALHDEEETFREEQEAARRAGKEVRLGLDWFAVVVSFKGVFLEGLEVGLIVLALGGAPGRLAPALLGAAVALVLVGAVGLIAHRPLRRLPETHLKLGVGVALTAFGTFFAAEGLGVEWPLADVALLYVAGVFAVAAWFAIHVLSRDTPIPEGA
jgi:uncharacterized membrane protein